jgi:hypothetical protein
MQVLMDTDEMAAHPVLGPLIRGVVSRLELPMKPNEAVLPITKLPGIGLPSPIPIPNLNRCVLLL